MCGIAGIFSPNNTLENCIVNQEKLFQGINHRGPNGSGVIKNESSYILYHTRLSIVDLTEQGSQPVTSFNDRYILVYNGEVYNYKELGRICSVDLDLDTVSDTRVVLEYISEFGLIDFLNRAQGMWAFCLYDKVQKCFTLVRDISGQKPLYYFISGENIVFSSTITSLIQAKNENLSVNHIHEFISTGSIDFADIGIVSLSPGSFLQFDRILNKFISHSYYGLPTKRINKSTEENLETLLSKHTEWLLRSHVPVGIFLSGGIDSTLLATLLKKYKSGNLVRAYSVSFDSEDFDESKQAKKSAKKLDLDLKIIQLDSSCIKRFFSEVNFGNLDFISDTSFLPIYFLSESAGRDVKVALTGDGGDEIMGGYNRHIFAYDNSFKYHILRRIVKYFKFSYGLVSAVASQIGDAQLVRKIDKVFNNNSGFNGNNHSSIDEYGYSDLMTRDFNHYLPTVLNKVDSATMYHGIEARTMYLNKEIVDFCFGLDMSQLIGGGVGKKLFRKILRKHDVKIPRRKMGFTPPLHSWLTNDLRAWLHIELESLDSRVKEVIRSRGLEIGINQKIKLKDAELIWRILFISYKLKQLENEK